MSRRKIVINKVKKPRKERQVSVNEMMAFNNRLKRAHGMEYENAEVVALITSNKLDTTKLDDHKYIKEIAKELNWSRTKLVKTIDRVMKLLKEEEIEENKDEEKSV
jgi:DNA-binding MarR family transcriptional regulator